MGELVLTLSCPDRPGIVHAVSGFLAERECNILDSQQYGSPRTETFFMRVHVDAPVASPALRADFAAVADPFRMSWRLHDADDKPDVLVLVSREGHCLADLLYRWRSGYLPGRLAAVASNHRDLELLATPYGVPFHYLPVDADTRAAQEAQILDLVSATGADLVVLARYMQILSPQLCAALPGRLINIHHSFLPSFRGGRPYEQAYERGVKLIGATAHYVTADLDEGPIIEQEISRVGHQNDPAALAAIGRDLECVALARAVRWHLEHRVLLDGTRTVIFFVTQPSDKIWEARRKSFGAAAENYRSGRPGYPREVIERCLPAGAAEVLDLAAGTGPLTAGLLDLGLSVTAVEPLDDMRALIPREAHAIPGTAEDIPLPDASVDAVFIGQAWHWFDIPRAVAEIHRVLRPGGVLAPMWNLFDAEDPLCRVLGEVGPDECSTNMLDDTDPPFDPTGLFSAPTRVVARYALPYTRDRVEALVASMSVSILAAPEDRERMLATVRAGMPDGEFSLSWICEAWYSVKLPATKQ